MYLRLVSLAVCFIYVAVQAAHAFDDDDENLAKALKLVNQMADTRKGLSALRQVLDGIDQDLQDTQKRWGPSCAIGAGMPGYQCHLAALRGDGAAKHFVGNSPLSPGKRNIDIAAANRKVKDLLTKRKGLDVLKKILAEMDADLVYEQKRTCRVNLGGHCATESAAAVADQWHYLNSPLSPGRKRRDTRTYRKLITGKLFN